MTPPFPSKAWTRPPSPLSSLAPSFHEHSSTSTPPPMFPQGNLLDTILEITPSPKGIIITSNVKGAQITLSHAIIGSIFGLKFTKTTPSSLTRKKAKDLCLAEYACTDKLAEYKHKNKPPPYTVLLPEPRLLHFVLFRTIYPKENSREASNEIVLAVIYRLMIGYSFDYASIVLDDLYRVSCVTRTPSLPYGNLLTNVFQHFGIPLDSEECITQSVPVISAHFLKTLRFYKTEHQGWQHVSDLTPEEATILHVSRPEPYFIPNMVAILTELKEDNATLRSQVEHLQFN
ncbi:hypothetical protein Cgig2_030329 [Carnegiea gigantea]|uniref:Uncharacterized protein n=1 Tax=Carnegiea gigantea TaxID=171969 RepID=A0A9Q1GSR9_9CARY|nr:hypothetical protein Cgig2_030329 [Carnegiea gigantea]